MASIVLSFGGKEIKTYELDRDAMVVGRDPGVDIVIDNLGVSRSHCQFIKRGNVFVIQDMNSANGTFVNGKKVGEHNLNDNDQIVVGKYAMTFKAAGTAPAGSKAPAGRAAVPAGGPVVPDSMNTYMMDGDKIKERLEEMRRQEETKQAAPQPADEARSKRGGTRSSPPVSSSPSRPETKHHTKIVMGSSRDHSSGGRTIKRYLMLSLVLNVVLIVIIGIMMYFFHQTVSAQNRSKNPSLPTSTTSSTPVGTPDTSE